MFADEAELNPDCAKTATDCVWVVKDCVWAVKDCVWVTIGCAVTAGWVIDCPKVKSSVLRDWKKFC